MSLVVSVRSDECRFCTCGRSANKSECRRMYYSKVLCFLLRRHVYEANGRGGIRTHGGLPHARFRVECLKPDSATLPCGRRKRRSPPALEASAWQASNVEHPISNATIFQIGCWALDVERLYSGKPTGPSGSALADRIVCLTTQKNVTIKGLPRLLILLHLVCPHGQPRYYLLLTAVHRFLAPLFTSIPSLFENLNPPLPP